MRKSLVVILLLAAATASSVFFVGRTQTRANSAKGTPAPQLRPMPEHFTYSILFHHIAFLKQKVDETEAKGQYNSTLLKRFQEDSGLDDAQFQALLKVATECEQAAREQDKKAKAIIDAFRTRYPDGKLPRGEKVPPPPRELEALQQERDATVLRARDRIHESLGDQNFTRFDAFVKRHASEHAQARQPNQ